MSFSKIARVYDQFNDLSAYEHWLDFTLHSTNKAPRKLLDVACGTGWFTQIIASFVDEITLGVDIDPAMLEMAREESHYEGAPLFKQGDMLDLSSFDTDYDIVTCYADSLCFLKDEKEVTQAIGQMYQRLNGQGVLLFDVWTPFQLDEGFENFSYADTNEEAAILWDSYPLGNNEVEHYLTTFEVQEDGRYVRQDSILIERTYPLIVFKEAIQKAGFSSFEVSVEYGEEVYDPKRHAQATRWFFRCYK